MLGVNEVRQTFLSYFGKNGHEIVSSSPLIPHNDPTLLFVNAGMVPFKNYFTGVETPPYPRATSSQKCVRAGGKHNDLDNVGYTARHHTFFEMLGNFSFGDYFKEEAIFHAWTLLTKDFGLPAEKLLVTVYAEDEEAATIWKKLTGFSDDKIIRINTNDNFWSMGDTGPCGPCSEIFYDHGESIWGGKPGTAEQDGDRFIEIWNLVFMQYEQKADGSRILLPKPSIDTGMGLERVSAVLQGQHDNYDINIMKALTNAVARLSNTAPDGEFRNSHRVIADHLRSTCFLIADGVLPSNEGRGYVLRRIMRRAMRHIHLLGVNEPTMYKLVPTLLEQMGSHYSELGRAKSLIEETLLQEEGRFQSMLGRGLKLLEDELGGLSSGQPLSGDVAFKLYDTYGFPLDLTQDVLRSKNLTVDVAGFETAMDKQRAEARANWSGSGEKAEDSVWYNLREKLGATEFLGYDATRTKGQQASVVAIVKDGQIVTQAQSGDTVSVVFNQTPFYAESGGQIGDTGTAIANDAAVSITNTIKVAGDLFVHQGFVTGGVLKEGHALTLTIDETRRKNIQANHSATHLLHKALRQVLGDHVVQKGSLVTEERLRFDFSHSRPVTADERKKVEALVNAQVRGNAGVNTALMSPEDAISAGALALFGEKYGKEVRVLSMGLDAEKSYSVELCGGTHVSRLGDIGLFKIVSEGGVSSGVRRIEAMTGEGAFAYLDSHLDIVEALSATFKTPSDQVLSRVQKLQDERKTFERELMDLKRQMAVSGGASTGSGDSIEVVNGVNFVAHVVDNLPARELAGLIDQTKAKIGSGVVVFLSRNDDRVALAVGVTTDLTEKFSAVTLVKTGTEALGGKGGGGRPDFAQSGGADVSKVQQAITSIKEHLSLAS